MVKIKKQLISSRAATGGNGNVKKYITIHQTANTTKGANAQAHANLQSNGNSRQASWHWQVDDNQAIQSFDHNVKCWHAGNRTGNNESIGIELCVNSDAHYKKVLENAAELIKKIMKDENISIGNVVQHNKWSGKNCPAQIRVSKDGVGWTQFIALVQGKDVSTSKPIKPKPSKPKDDGKLSVDGYWGKATTRALQKSLGTTQDGILSGQNRNSITNQLESNTVSVGGGGSLVVKELQKLVGVKQDGLLGPATIKALQKYLGTTQDGKLSKPSLVVKELQRQLNSGDFGKKKASSGSKKSSKQKENLAVDGKWGKGTTKALQRALGTTADGIISGQNKHKTTNALYGGTVSFKGSHGSQVIKALQKKIGANADGSLGPATIKALQKYLGTTQDGVLSRPSLVVKELQRRLNKGTF